MVTHVHAMQRRKRKTELCDQNYELEIIANKQTLRTKEHITHHKSTKPQVNEGKKNKSKPKKENGELLYYTRYQVQNINGERCYYVKNTKCGAAADHST